MEIDDDGRDTGKIKWQQRMEASHRCSTDLGISTRVVFEER
jgi:hypothetical protein